MAEDEEHEEENKREEPGGEDKALVRNRGDQVPLLPYLIEILLSSKTPHMNE